MERKSIGKRIWEILGPIVIKEAILMGVMFVVSFIYCMRDRAELFAVANSQEELVNKVFEISNEILMYSVEITAIGALLSIPIFVWMRKKDLRTELAMGIVQNRKAPLSKYLLIVGISIPAVVVANEFLILSNLAEYSAAYQETAEALYAPSLLVQILCLGIVVPICEEYVFRGLIYKRLKRRGSTRGAMITSAIFFGVWHQNSVQLVYAVALGVLLAYLYEKYGSLKAPIFAHMLMNTVSCILTAINAFDWMFAVSTRLILITVACAAIGSTVFLCIREINEKSIPSQQN